MHVSEWNVSWPIAFLNTSAYDIVQSYVDDRIPKVISPAFYKWTDTLSHIPQKFNYTHMYEYLMKREVIVLSADGVIIDNVMLPVVEKQTAECLVCGRARRQMQPCRSNLVCPSRVPRITDED